MSTCTEFCFEVPARLLTPPPTERRGEARDAARLLVSRLGAPRSLHRRARDLPDLLDPGDVLVVNRSQTVAAAIPLDLAGAPHRLHVSRARGPGEWLVELRRVVGDRSVRTPMTAGPLRLPGGDSVDLLAPLGDGPLWRARTDVPDLHTLATLPVQYDNLAAGYPLDYYRTTLGTVPGSAEMPSAGRPLTEAVLTGLRARGIQLAPVLLHTGLSSPERHEGPLPEYFEVGPAAAKTINAAREVGRRVVSIGTTAVRATESAADDTGRVHAARGWTDIHLTATTPLRVSTGLLTGFHEPEASHLDLLRALAPAAALDAWYAEALAEAYRWHEFGDVQLILAE